MTSILYLKSVVHIFYSKHVGIQIGINSVPALKVYSQVGDIEQVCR